MKAGRRELIELAFRNPERRAQILKFAANIEGIPEFLEEKGSNKFKNPGTGREVSISTAIRDTDHPLYSKARSEYQKWKESKRESSPEKKEEGGEEKLSLTEAVSKKISKDLEENYPSLKRGFEQKLKKDPDLRNQIKDFLLQYNNKDLDYLTSVKNADKVSIEASKEAQKTGSGLAEAINSGIEKHMKKSLFHRVGNTLGKMKVWQAVAGSFAANGAQKVVSSATGAVGAVAGATAGAVAGSSPLWFSIAFGGMTGGAIGSGIGAAAFGVTKVTLQALYAVNRYSRHKAADIVADQLIQEMKEAAKKPGPKNKSEGETYLPPKQNPLSEAASEFLRLAKKSPKIKPQDISSENMAEYLATTISTVSPYELSLIAKHTKDNKIDDEAILKEMGETLKKFSSMLPAIQSKLEKKLKKEMLSGKASKT